MPIRIEKHKPLFNIGVAAQKLNVSVSTLRMYENEGLIITYRTETGRRVYSLADLDRIRSIRQHIKQEGLNLAGIRRLMALIPCWEKGQCASNSKHRCKVFHDSKLVCWMVPETLCKLNGSSCRSCQIYRKSSESIENLLPLLRNAPK